MNMKILLVNIYYHSTRVKYMISSYILKTYYEANSPYSDHNSIIVNNFSSILTPEAITQNILDINADAIGFSCYVWNMDLAVAVIKNLRRMGFGGCIIMGGPEISERNPMIFGLREHVDYFVVGEGEIAFTQLIDGLFQTNRQTNKLPPGVLHYDSAANLFQYTKQNSRVDMTKIPSIYATNIIPEDLYAGELVFLETQRGCKYRCQYCFYHKNLRGITFRDINDIKQEISFLLTKRNITSIRIVDSVFSSDLERAKNILRFLLEMKNAGRELKKILIEYEYHDVDEEYIDLISQFKQSSKISINNYNKVSLPIDCPIGDGFEILDGYTAFSGVGLQSFNNAALKAVGRQPICAEEINNFFHLCKDYNILLKLDIILGLPEETVDSYFSGLNRLFAYMEETDHYFQPAILMVLPGTILEISSEKLGLRYDKLSKIVYETNTMTKADLRYCAKITGLAYRLINSPLRREYCATVKRTSKNFIEVVIAVYQHLLSSSKMTNFFDNEKINLYEYIDSALFFSIKQEELCMILNAIESQEKI